MASSKRKFVSHQLDDENPQKSLPTKKSKGKSQSKIDSTRWPNDVSNTLQRPTHKQKSKNQGHFIFSQLPDEIILTILTYLNKPSIVAFGQTSRRYRAIAYHPTLWRRVDMSYKRIDTKQLNSLLQRGTITLKMYQTTVNDLNSISFASSGLRHLDLTSAIVSSDLLFYLLNACRSLRKLSLELIPLNENIIEKIAANEQLETLNLVMCTGITDGCGQLLTSKLSLLRCLNLAWTDLSIDTVRNLCETMPRCIEQLNLSGQRYSLTDDHIQSLVRRVLRLRVLDISDSVLLTDQSLIALRQHSRLLVHLSASRCYLLTAPGLIPLKLLPAFSTLDIFGTLPAMALQQLRDEFGTRIHLNMCPFSTIARPTTGIQRTSIWGLRTR